MNAYWLNFTEREAVLASTCQQCGSLDADITSGLCFDCFKNRQTSWKPTKNMSDYRINELRAALKNVIELAEEGRQTVTPITKCLTQIDMDAAAAVCRGSFMTIVQFCEAVYKRTENYNVTQTETVKQILADPRTKQ